MDRKKRIATNRWALPVALLFSTSLWAVRLVVRPSGWPAFLIFILSVSLMVEINNRNALMRQYSRMVSCSYIALMMMCDDLLSDIRAMAVQSAVIISLLLIFSTYQQRGSVGRKYWAYLFIGLASMAWPPMLLLVPVWWIGEASCLMSFTGRSFVASLFGIATPFWTVTPLFFVPGVRGSVLQCFTAFVPEGETLRLLASPGDIILRPLPLDNMQAGVAAFLVVLFLVSAIRYFRQSSADKIHVRMLYQFFTLLSSVSLLLFLVVTLFPLFSPTAWHLPLAVFIASAAPLVGHYVTFSSGRLSALVFWLSFSAAVITAIVRTTVSLI